MRAELRRQADEIWVIDCSPEGHQPKVATRIFQDVQQPVCIVMAARGNGSDATARVKHRALPHGDRTGKFAALDEISLDDDGWTECPSEPRASFLPRSTGAWRGYAALEELFIYNGAGVMPGRTWVIAPDRETLTRRWEALQSEVDAQEKEALFHPHQLGDRNINKVFDQGLRGHEFRAQCVAADTKPVVRPTRYAYRSFDRQWILPDLRLINRPNPALWELHSNDQVYMTALHMHSPSGGPAVTFCAAIPDLHHHSGRGGRFFPMWCDRQRRTTNVKPGLLREMTEVLGIAISGPDFMAYVAGLAAHPAYTARFQADLVQPGLRVPLTSDSLLFGEAVNIGREIIWLHCFGERFADANVQRPQGPPRMPKGDGPVIPKTGAIPTGANQFPDRIEYDGGSRRLKIGEGFVDNVPAAVWEYKVSGKPVLVQWFSYRRLDRSRPKIGARRQPSSLNRIQPDCWQAEYTTELMNVLHILGRLVALESRQADLLERICGGTLIGGDDLRAKGAFDSSVKVRRRAGVAGQGLLLE